MRVYDGKIWGTYLLHFSLLYIFFGEYTSQKSYMSVIAKLEETLFHTRENYTHVDILKHIYAILLSLT